jgi:hypothetical protein
MGRTSAPRRGPRVPGWLASNRPSASCGCCALAVWGRCVGAAGAWLFIATGCPLERACADMPATAVRVHAVTAARLPPSALGGCPRSRYRSGVRSNQSGAAAPWRSADVPTSNDPSSSRNTAEGNRRWPSISSTSVRCPAPCRRGAGTSWLRVTCSCHATRTIAEPHLRTLDASSFHLLPSIAW